MKKEINILKQYYKDTLSYVDTDDFCVKYAHEKMIHSLQVIGAGNYIKKHEKTFHNRTDDFMLCATLSYLFHDIGRFDEIKLIFDKKAKTTDHGVLGANILASIDRYNDPRIILSVKHHGHLIEKFYNDIEYQSMSDKTLKKEIEEIIFLCRDADKIANLYLLKTQYDKHEGVWASSQDESFIKGDINPVMVECIKNNKVCPRADIKSNADIFIAVLSWMFDINYQTSIDFCKKHKVVEAVVKIIARYNKQVDIHQELTRCMNEYLDNANLNKE